MEEMGSYKRLLNSYLSLWNNRSYQNGSGSEEEQLVELVKRELLDENSHPRIRKTKHEKFYLSTSRIIESDLDDSAKVALIRLYTELFNDI
ncbi:hypothetical protein JOC77_001942 [Peribacillus deserti]|uniref:Uncharacterized protein n=1 Tax=Peribacillus deserti TaxID=673318 RepID=A0ABS2QH92_9BACI|nr:hypothetical protein [Peribacillus deserti]MBM7692512.1 hypothetical protein [Peribacillus deserti]